MKRRWRILIALGTLAAIGIATPIGYVELACHAPVAGFDPAAPYRAILPARRPEARTWLTYPEWHIVYSADAFGRYLAAGKPPSGYGYGGDIAGFWRGFCAINRVSRGRPGVGEAKLMIYTIGISFTAELAIKAAYERTVGRVSEWLGGWRSADDRHAARVQQAYGAFMHETPWFRFPFGQALAGEWRTAGDGEWLRHGERRVALSAEYLVKGGYAKLLDSAAGATLGRDEPTLRFVARADPATLTALDPRLKPVARRGDLIVIEAPRYAQFTDLIGKLTAARVPVIEIAGNDDIFATWLAPAGVVPEGAVLLSMPLADRAGWRRVGVSVKVRDLIPAIRRTEARGARLEHVYDY